MQVETILAQLADSERRLTDSVVREAELRKLQNRSRQVDAELEMSIARKQLEKARQELQKQKLQGNVFGRANGLALPGAPYFSTSQSVQPYPLAVTLEPPFLPSRSGTGFSIGDGYIVTTADVLGGMIKPTIVTADGKKISGTVVGIYEDLNLGVIKLNEASDLPALPLGDSDGATVGHFAISVGNLGGQTSSAALLLIGAVNEQGMNSGSRYYPRLIQIAGTVGEGTSGAPLVDSKGEVIGMMVAVPVQSASPNTIYFAPQAQTGVNVPGVPGVPFMDFRTIPDEALSATDLYGQARSLFVSPTGATEIQEGRPGSGLPLASPPGSPSDQDAAGITPVQPPRLPSGVRKPQAIPPAQGSRLPVVPLVTPSPPRYYRGQNLKSLFESGTQRYVLGSANTYALGSASSAVTSAGFAVPINLLKSVIADIKAGKKVVRGWIGISPSDITRTSDRGGGTLFIESYVAIEVIYPNSPASLAGLRSGDILTKVDGKKITRASEVREISLSHRPGDQLKFTVERPGKENEKRDTLDFTLTIQAKPEVIPNPAK